MGRISSPTSPPNNQGPFFQSSHGFMYPSAGFISEPSIHPFFGPTNLVGEWAPKETKKPTKKRAPTAVKNADKNLEIALFQW